MGQTTSNRWYYQSVTSCVVDGTLSAPHENQPKIEYQIDLIFKYPPVTINLVRRNKPIQPGNQNSQNQWLLRPDFSSLRNWQREKINVREKENKILITSTRGRFSQFDLFFPIQFLFPYCLLPPFISLHNFIFCCVSYFLWFFCLTILEQIYCLPLGVPSIRVVFCMHSTGHWQGKQILA